MPPVFKRVSDGQVRYRPGGVDTPFTSEVTKTTTGNIDDLDFSNAQVIRMNNATDSTIRGLVAGVAGQVVVIVSIGAGNVFLAHQNAGSAVANRLTNIATSANTPLAAGRGVATFVYDATTARWRLVDHKQGAALTATFAAGDFLSSAGAGTWTVDGADISALTYELEEDFLTVEWAILTTTIASTPINLILANGQWGGFTAAGVQVLQTSLTFTQGGVFGVGFAQIGSGGGLSTTQIWMYQIPVAAWANATNTTAVYGGLRFQVS